MKVKEIQGVWYWLRVGTLFNDQIRINLGKKCISFTNPETLSSVGKFTSETEGGLPSSSSEVYSGPPPDSEVIYDDVPCENIPSPDAGMWKTLGSICTILHVFHMSYGYRKSDNSPDSEWVIPSAGPHMHFHLVHTTLWNDSSNLRNFSWAIFGQKWKSCEWVVTLSPDSKCSEKP